MKPVKPAGISDRVWRMWSATARHVFATTYGACRYAEAAEVGSPLAKLRGVMPGRPHRWNAAFVAAFAVDGYEIVGVVDG